MKRLVVILAVVCILFAGVVGYMTYIDQPEKEAEPTAEPETTGTPEAEESAAPITVLTLDYDALYASHEPDEVVAQINGKDVRWDEYFYWIAATAGQVENYISTMANYGLAVNWDDPWSTESEQSFVEYVVWSSEENLKMLATVEDFAAENDVQLSEEILAQIDEEIQSTIASVCGEDADEEDFEEYLKSLYMTRAIYERMTRTNYLYQEGYNQLYGKNGELVSDEAALNYLTDNEYLSATHILLMTVDSATGEALDEDTIAQQKAKAEELAAELQAITDQQELVARFAELKEQYCEDTGKTLYPDGYTFTPGTMVAEFEDTCKALEEYQVSDPVLTTYGYHVIMRLPLSADGIIDYSSAGTPLTARSYTANAEYASRMDAQYEKAVFEYVPGFSINIEEFLK